jgi:membrane fusion protein (multidrug efflux system)
MGCGAEQAQPPVSDAGPPGGAAHSVVVTTAVVVRGPVGQRISAPGTLAPVRESRIGAEVSGRIERVFVAEGDRVAQDDPLFQIDPEPYELARRQTEAGVDLARAERRQVESDLARARVLLQKNVASQQEVDRLATQLAVARAQERKVAEGVALAELNLRRTLVKAPYTGAIVERYADEGTTAQAQPQTIVVVLQETAELEGRATIPEVHLRAVQVGDRALLHVGGFPEPIETTISSVGDAVDPDTRTYEVRMRVPNPDYRFKGGVFAHVEIEPAPKPDALLVPREALRTGEGRNRVLTVREGLAFAVPVRIGIVTDEVVEVLAGLELGERVIVGEAAQTVVPGMPVRVRADGVAGP